MNYLRIAVALLGLIGIIYLGGCAAQPATPAASQPAPSDTSLPYEPTIGYQFATGTLNATDKEGNLITVNDYKKEAVVTYGGEFTEYDVDGDKQAELCIRTDSSFDIFKIDGQTLTLWYRADAMYHLLNNGALKREMGNIHSGDHTVEYVLLNSDGTVKETVTYGTSGTNYTYNGQSVTKEQYQEKIAEIETLKSNAITWWPLEQ